MALPAILAGALFTALRRAIPHGVRQAAAGAKPYAEGIGLALTGKEVIEASANAGRAIAQRWTLAQDEQRGPDVLATSVQEAIKAVRAAQRQPIGSRTDEFVLVSELARLETLRDRVAARQSATAERMSIIALSSGGANERADETKAYIGYGRIARRDGLAGSLKNELEALRQLEPNDAKLWEQAQEAINLGMRRLRQSEPGTVAGDPAKASAFPAPSARDDLTVPRRQSSGRVESDAALRNTREVLTGLQPIQERDLVLTQGRQQATFLVTEAIDNQCDALERNVSVLAEKTALETQVVDNKPRGIEGGIDAYLKDTDDLAAQTANSTAKAMAALEDQFANVFARGKFDARAFGDVVIGELSRIMAKQAMLALFGGQGEGGASGGGLLGRVAEAAFGIYAGMMSNGSGVTLVGSTATSGASSLPDVTLAGDVSTFARAGRYHTGGVIGSGEVPIIARHGEGVFTPAQMSRLAPASALQPIVVNQSIQVDARADSSAIRQGMLAAKNEAIREIANQFQRDGAMRRVAN